MRQPLPRIRAKCAHVVASLLENFVFANREPSMKIPIFTFICSAAIVLAAHAQPGTGQKRAGEGEWIQLFNGKNLDNWTPKITGHELNENFGDTFRVENGVLKVSYDKYQDFGGQFGHLFYREPYSDYRLRIEYRFVAEQVPGGPDWAFRNSGVMLHCQPPETMAKDQKFPVSIEVQFLGGRETGERPTANLCTPGTHVVMAGQLLKRHCTDSKSKTYRGDQWVTVEIEVHGSGTIRHIVEGKTVLEYSQPQLDEDDPDAKKLIEQGSKKEVSGGFIALQSESHPIEFRKVELMRLKPAK